MNGDPSKVAFYSTLLNILVAVKKGILDIQFLPNPHLHEEKGKGIKASEWLLQKGVDRVYTRKPFEGKGPSYVFASAEVEVRVTDARTVEEIHSEFTTRLHL